MPDREDPEEVAKVLRRIRAQEATLWGRKVVEMDVTPAMLVHRDGGGCLCDECGRMGQATPVRAVNHIRPVGKGAMIRRKPVLATEPPPKDIGTPASKYARKDFGRMNKPVSVPVWAPFVGRCME